MIPVSSPSSGTLIYLQRQLCLWIVVISLFFAAGCEGTHAGKTDDGPSPEKTPEEELASFEIEPGLTVQLVAAEPMVQDPVVITFDQDGRLWVVEMRGFMPDIDGLGEKDPIGRVSVLEDTNGDGRMDVSTVYIDSLILPRAIALVPGGALIVEDAALWLTQDINSDLKADTKTLIDPDYAGSPLPEHSGNGLWRGMDNWYYNAKSRFRYRLVEGTWKRDSTEFRGQWGLSHDDEGRLYYNYNWSQLHADLVPPNALSRNKNHKPTTGIDHGLTLDRRVYPIRPNPAVNRGYIPGTLDESGRLLEFTAACSPLFYRGTALPSAYYGNVFVCEPSGNLIKRNTIKSDGLMLAASDPHPGREFLASTDERFRPVHLSTGPDGALYIADMYRGLVQHGAHVTPYLREQTISRKLVQPINRGRIWRVVPTGWKEPTHLKLSKATAEELIANLSNPNGWHRDIAQRLLVERDDQSKVHLLVAEALNGESDLGRLHALWTIEGMNQVSPAVLFRVLSDPSPILRITALRLLEPFAKENTSIRIKLQEMLTKSTGTSIKESLQIALTASVLDEKASHEIIVRILHHYDTSAVIRDAALSSLQDGEFQFLKTLMTSTSYKTPTPHKEIFLEMLTASVIKKRNPEELAGLLSMLEVDKIFFGWKEKTILTGLSVQARNRNNKAIQLTSAPRILTRKDIAIESSSRNALLAMFEWPGHRVEDVSLPKTLLTEDDQKQFTLGRQHYLSTCAGCHGTDGAGLSRFAPTLIGSDWVLGDEKRLALILLHGMEGPVDVAGKVYDVPDILPVMPPHSTLDDGAITAIMTYIRNEWGNQASPVSRRIVGTTRHTSQGRVVPWTAGELNEHLAKTKSTAIQ